MNTYGDYDENEYLDELYGDNEPSEDDNGTRQWLYNQMIGGLLRRRVVAHLESGGVVMGYEGHKVTAWAVSNTLFSLSNLADMVMRCHWRGGRVEFGVAGSSRLAVCGY